MHLITHRRLTQTPLALPCSPLQHAREHVLVNPRNSSPTHFRILPKFLEFHRKFPDFSRTLRELLTRCASAHSLTDQRSERSLRALLFSSFFCGDNLWRVRRAVGHKKSGQRNFLQLREEKLCGLKIALTHRIFERGSRALFIATQLRASWVQALA